MKGRWRGGWQAWEKHSPNKRSARACRQRGRRVFDCEQGIVSSPSNTPSALWVQFPYRSGRRRSSGAVRPPSQRGVRPASERPGPGTVWTVRRPLAGGKPIFPIGSGVPQVCPRQPSRPTLDLAKGRSDHAKLCLRSAMQSLSVPALQPVGRKRRAVLVASKQTLLMQSVQRRHDCRANSG